MKTQHKLIKVFSKDTFQKILRHIQSRQPEKVNWLQ